MNLMIPPGVVLPEDYGEVHSPERVSAYYNNGMTCDDDLVERADWRLHYRETIITEPQVTLRNRVSNQPYQAIRVNVPVFRGANAKWFMCPYRHNLIFIEGTHCAYTGTILPFCSCALCAGFQPWPFRSDTVWNGIRYVLVYTGAWAVGISSVLLSRRPRDSHADEDGDEDDSVHRVRVARRQRPRSNATGSSTPSPRIQCNVIHHACVGIDGVVGSDDVLPDDLPDLLTPVIARVPEDIDLSSEPLNEPVIVLDDLDFYGTLLHSTPLPGPHVVVMNVVTGQPYRVQRMSTRQRDHMTSTWYRDVYRQNITYISGTLCQATMTSIASCNCGVCNCIRMILSEHRSCMRPMSPSSNLETYVYVREHIPTATHSPLVSSHMTYIDDTIAPHIIPSDNAADAITDDDYTDVPEVEPFDTIHESYNLNTSSLISVLHRYARAADETLVSTPVPVMRDSDTPAVANHFPYRSRRSIRHQSVSPVRSPHPMINGYDDAHEHTEVNTHTMNDSERDRDDDIDDDISACERDPNDHRRWRRTRVATIESTNIQSSNSPTESSSDRPTSVSSPIFFRSHL